jgi:hypothetical protein
MIPPPRDPKKVKISRPTFIGVDEEIDKEFKEFLEFLEISMELREEEEGEWPVVEYEGNPYDISTMLASRFGMDESEIKEEYPQLFS